MPTIKIHNIDTDETIEREMTKAEIDELEISGKSNDEWRLLEQQKANVTEKLNKLGLTVDEIKVLGLG